MTAPVYASFLSGIDEEQIKEKALAEPVIQRHLQDHEIKKVLYVKGRLVNVVVGEKS